MPFQSRPPDKVFELVDSLGGSVWTSVTDMVAGGAAVARTEIENMYVPDKAKTLLGWRPIDYATDQAVSESALAVFDISGGNYNFQPQEVICGNVANSILTDAAGMLHAASEYFDVFAPVSGGEQISIGIEPVDAIAGNRRSGAEFTWTDVKLPLPTIRSYCSREVAITAATAGIIAATTLTLSHAHKLVEIDAVATHALPTIEEEMNITAIFRCNALPINEIKIMLEPVGCLADLGTDEGTALAYLSRRLQSLKFSQESATVYCDMDVDVAQTAAGQFVHCLRYI
jgi:hypothetical protein